MESVKAYKENLKPTVFIISNYSPFSLYLLENLLSSQCNVVVFCEDVSTWKNNLSHISKTQNIIIEIEKNINKFPKPNYFILLDFDNTSNNLLFKKLGLISNALRVKGFLVVSEDVKIDNNIMLSDNTGIIVVNNLFGPRMNLESKNRISDVIYSILEGSNLKIFINEKITPMFMGTAAKMIVKWLFSFGPYGKAITFTSTSLDLLDMCQKLQSSSPNFQYQLMASNKPDQIDVEKETYLIKDDQIKFLEDTIRWFKDNHVTKIVPKKAKKVKPWLIPVILGVLFLFISPYIFLSLSAASFYLSVKLILSNRIDPARYLNKTSSILSKLSLVSSKSLVGVPLFSNFYKPAASYSYILNNSNSITERGYGLISQGHILVNNIFSDKGYDLLALQKEIVTNLDYIETKLAFTQGELKNYSNLYNKVDITEYRKLVTNINKLFYEIPDLLGINKNKKYLILLQNNMELRPTGGFIGSFALISFNSGNIGEISVQDVYSADGQLKGHIEPPEPIKKYLKEANWFLRDSNWNPDFTISAKQAKWFLEKEIDISVDGVIAIDMNVIKDYLEISGPIFLDDYQTEITSDNFYEKTQAEVEKNFFPGSTKKASFITALTKEITSTLFEGAQDNITEIAKLLYTNLQEKHIQIYLNNEKTKEPLANLNWDGGFNYVQCSNNCISDHLAIVEANLGVNKANYYIQRNYELTVNINEKRLIRNLKVIFKNSAGLAMGETGVYKNYARIYIPLNSELNFVRINQNLLATDTKIVSGQKEVGLYFELPPEQIKTLDLSWSESHGIDLQKAGEYILNLRKQAGIPSENITIKINSIDSVDLNPNASYNTLFAKDIYTKTTWIK